MAVRWGVLPEFWFRFSEIRTAWLCQDSEERLFSLEKSRLRARPEDVCKCTVDNRPEGGKYGAKPYSHDVF